jgi:ADP-ribose pyrophosphatase
MASAHPHKSFPILIGSQPVYAGRVVSLRVDELEVASGVNVRREVVEHPGAVVVVAEDTRGRLLWVRQHRYPIGGPLLELPAGTLDGGEAPEACARRELAEETGFQAALWRPLGAFYTAPGFCTEYMHAFAARDLSPASGHHADADEEIEVVPLTLEESLSRVDAGEVRDAKSLAALLLYTRAFHRP